MEKENKHTLFKILSLLIIIIVILFLIGRFIYPYNLIVNETPIYNKYLPLEYNGFKIVQFSDIHYGRTTNESELKKVVNKINELNADIIIFTGDLFDSSKPSNDSIKIVTKYLNKMNAKIKKLAIIGDYDQKYLDTYQDILINSNFTLLDNEKELIYYKSSTPLNFIGLTNTKDLTDLYSNEYLNITLIHKPDLITDIKANSLVFAGHSLGGQIKIPFVGGIIKKEGAKTYLDKHYQLKNQDLYISNGIGTEKFSFRLFNSPSISLYRLYHK